MSRRRLPRGLPQRAAAAALAVCLVAAAGPGAAQAGGPDSQARARADSAVTRADSASADPAFDWLRWPAIGPAIALQPLDGPGDILEKQEIIADRVDDLIVRGAALDTLGNAWDARHEAMSAQLEVLDDLAGVQLGGDLEFQQRLENVRDEVRQAAREKAHIDSSRRLLATEVTRLRALSDDYRDQAARLRQQEESDR